MPKDEIIKLLVICVSFFGSLILFLCGIIGYFIVTAFSDNRKEHTETRLHAEKTDTKLETVLIEIGKIQTICRERSGRKNINGKN